MKQLILVGIVLLVGAWSAHAQSIDLPEQDKGQFLMVAVYKSSQLNDSNSKIVISGGEEVKEVTELEGFLKQEDVKPITNTLNTIRDKGYELIQATGGGGSGGPKVAVLHYLFQKQ